MFLLKKQINLCLIVSPGIKSSLEINPKFFSNASKNKGDVEIFAKNASNSLHKSPENRYKPENVKLTTHSLQEPIRGLLSQQSKQGTAEFGSKHIGEKSPTTTEFLGEHDSDKGKRSSLLEKK